MLGAIIGDIVGSRWEFNPYIFWWFSEIWLFYFVLSSTCSTFGESTRRLNNKNKKDFILYCLRLAVPLHKIWIKVKEQK